MVQRSGGAFKNESNAGKFPKTSKFPLSESAPRRSQKTWSLPQKRIEVAANNAEIFWRQKKEKIAFWMKEIYLEEMTGWKSWATYSLQILQRLLADTVLFEGVVTIFNHIIHDAEVNVALWRALPFSNCDSG